MHTQPHNINSSCLWVVNFFSSSYSFVSVISFFFCPTQVRGEFLSFWEVWHFLPAFSGCSEGAVPRVNVFLLYLWEGRWSPRLTLPPSSPHSIIAFWFVVTMKFFYSNLSLYIYIYTWLFLSCWSLTFKCILKNLHLHSPPLMITVFDIIFYI